MHSRNAATQLQPTVKQSGETQKKSSKIRLWHVIKSNAKKEVNLEIGLIYVFFSVEWMITRVLLCVLACKNNKGWLHFTLNIWCPLFFCPSWSWVVEPSDLTLKTITLKWQQDSEAFAGLLGNPPVLFCMMLPCVLIYCCLMHYMHFCSYVCFWNNALLACITCIQYTVLWKSICCLSDFVLFVYMSHLKVLDPQYILIIDKYNLKKYKVLFKWWFYVLREKNIQPSSA